MPWKLDLKVQRVELAAFGLLALAIAIAAVWAIVLLKTVALSPACMQIFDGRAYTSGDVQSCPGAQAFGDVNGSWAGWIMASMAILPLFGGVTVGSQLIARDIEDRTAQWAWSLGLSRRRWLLHRAFPIMVVIVILAAVPALASWLLEAARNPSVDPGATFLDYGLRGPVVLWRAGAAFSISLLIGSVVGRSLPSLLLSAAAAFLMFFLLIATLGWGEALTVVPARDISASPGYLLISNAWMSPDGTIVSDSIARSRSPSPNDPEVTITWLVAHYAEVSLIIPGAELVNVEEHEILALTAIISVSLAATTMVVNRRRPY